MKFCDLQGTRKATGITPVLITLLFLTVIFQYFCYNSHTKLSLKEKLKSITCASHLAIHTAFGQIFWLVSPCNTMHALKTAASQIKNEIFPLYTVGAK